jgi:hypothetical protein
VKRVESALEIFVIASRGNQTYFCEKGMRRKKLGGGGGEKLGTQWALNLLSLKLSACAQHA